MKKTYQTFLFNNRKAINEDIEAIDYIRSL